MSARAPAATATPAGLAARQAPPFALPGSHFAAGVGFLLLGMGGLVWVAPELARGWYPSARVVAVTHLFTLGWITVSIWGALYQFLPVALGRPIRWIAVAWATLALFVPGLLAFVAGLVAGSTVLLLGGAAVFGVAVVAFVANLAATLWGAERRDLTWWSLVAASVYLLLTVLLGWALAGNLRWGYLGVSRWTALGVHLHVGLAGWVLMVVIGVAHRLLPMFLLSHGAPERWGRAAAALVASGVAWLAVLHHGGPVLARWVPALLLAAGVASFLVQARLFFSHRVRPGLDPGLRLAAGALSLLGAGLVLGLVWVPGVLGSASARGATAYIAAIVGGLTLFVAAHYYKIVPFLVWFHRYGPLVSERPVPKVAELYSARAAAGASVLLAVGLAGVVVATLFGFGGAARAASVVAAGGALVEAVQMGNLAKRRP